MPITVGEGGDTLTLKVSADNYLGWPHISAGFLPNGEYHENSIEYYEVAAQHGTATDTVTMKTNLPQGWHAFFVAFADDAFGEPGQDRNFYLESATYDGVLLPDAHMDFYEDGAAAFWFEDPGVPVVMPPVVVGLAVNGTSSADTLVGGAGPDTIQGFAGDDRLSGLEGNDIIRGGTGSDVITGGPGADTLTGASGRDVFVFRPGDGNDTVTDFVLGADSVLLNTAEGASVRPESRGGDDGALLRFNDQPGDSVFLAGADPLALSFGASLA